LFAEFDQSIDEAFGSLVVNVIVTGAMHDEEFALQAVREIDWRSDTIALSITRGQAHVSFLINRVVQLLIRHGRDGDACLVYIGKTEHRIERVLAAATPT